MAGNKIIRMVSQGYRDIQSFKDITHWWIGLTVGPLYAVPPFLEQAGKSGHPCAANADHVDLRFCGFADLKKFLDPGFHF